MNEHGMTLIELLLVLAILGILALTVIPTGRPQEAEKLDQGAAQVVGALRFARAEAVRTGNPYGVEVSAASQRLRVYRLDTSGFSPTPVYDVRNPFAKKLYDLQFATDPILAGVRVAAVALSFQGLVSPVNLVGFDAWGTPHYNDAGTIRLLNSGAITLGLGGAERSIRVVPMTGRITVL